jgi:hypothetical protein
MLLLTDLPERTKSIASVVSASQIKINPTQRAVGIASWRIQTPIEN